MAAVHVRSIPGPPSIKYRNLACKHYFCGAASITINAYFYHRCLHPNQLHRFLTVFQSFDQCLNGGRLNSSSIEFPFMSLRALSEIGETSTVEATMYIVAPHDLLPISLPSGHFAGDFW